jgi:hypothetical protein
LTPLLLPSGESWYQKTSVRLVVIGSSQSSCIHWVPPLGQVPQPTPAPGLLFGGSSPLLMPAQFSHGDVYEHVAVANTARLPSNSMTSISTEALSVSPWGSVAVSVAVNRPGSV